MEVLVPCKCHSTSSEMGQKCFQNSLHCHSRKLKIPREFLNSQAARLLPVPSAIHRGLSSAAAQSLSDAGLVRSCTSVLLQTHKPVLGTYRCVHVLKSGAFPSKWGPHWAATTPEPESGRQLFVILTHSASAFPLLPRATLSGKSRSPRQH